MASLFHNVSSNSVYQDIIKPFVDDYGLIIKEFKGFVYFGKGSGTKIFWINRVGNNELQIRIRTEFKSNSLQRHFLLNKNYSRDIQKAIDNIIDKARYPKIINVKLIKDQIKEESTSHILSEVQSSIVSSDVKSSTVIEPKPALEASIKPIKQGIGRYALSHANKIAEDAKISTYKNFISLNAIAGGQLDVFKHEESKLKYNHEQIDKEILYRSRLRENDEIKLDQYGNSDYEDIDNFVIPNNLDFTSKKIVDQLKLLKNNPYFARVVYVDEKNNTYGDYYFGYENIYVNNKLIVASSHTDMYNIFINSELVTKDKHNNDVRTYLKRRIEINNKILQKAQDSYRIDSSVAQENITDEFLISILNERRDSPYILDIVRTISEKQNKISRSAHDKHILVKGVAGSGKTMILLQRISFLLFREFYKKEDILIFSPIPNYERYFSTINEKLHLDEITHCSVNDYFVQILQSHSQYLLPEINTLKVSKNFKRIIYEQNFYDRFVNIYSRTLDEYISKLNIKSYNKIINKIKGIPLDINEYNFFDRDIISTIDQNLEKNQTNEQKLKSAFKELLRFNYTGIFNINKRFIQSEINLDGINFGQLNREDFVKIFLDIINSLPSKNIQHGDTRRKLENHIERINKDIVNYFSRTVFSSVSNQNVSKYLGQLLQVYKNIQVYVEDSKEILTVNEINSINSLKTKVLSSSRFKFLNDIINKFELRTKVEEVEKLSDREKNILQMIMLRITNKLNYSKIYKLICIDEIQDIAHSEFKLIELLNQNAIFNIYGDEDQQVYDEYKFSFNSLSLPFDIFELGENYRNRERITKHTNEQLNKSMLSIGLEGGKINQIKLDDIKAMKDIQIIIDEKNESGIKRLINLGISHDTEEGFIRYAFVKEIKGMEFKSVVVIERFMTMNDKYVSYTRALDELYIV